MDATTPSPLVVRLARSGALFGLTLILTIFLGLLLLASSQHVADLVVPVFLFDESASSAANWITLGFFVLVPVLLLTAALKLKVRSWWWIGGAYLAVAPPIAYLTVDDQLRHPVNLEELAPSFPGAEKSYAVVMQYSKQRPSDDAKAFAKWKPRITGLVPAPDKPEEWKAFLLKYRTDIEADWADLAPQRRWFAELNAFDRLGDLGEMKVDADIPTFQVWKTMAHRSVQMAGLRVLDGQPDEAIEMLVPVLQVGRKLQPSARSLVRSMIGIVVEKLPLEYAARIVENETVSPQSKAKVAAALKDEGYGEPGVRRLIAVESALMTGSLTGPLAKMDYRGFHSLHPLLFNPRRSANLAADLSRALEDLAARRELSADHAKRIQMEKTRPSFKNFLGTRFVDQWTPEYHNVVRTYWNLHDTRERLIARLSGTP